MHTRDTPTRRKFEPISSWSEPSYRPTPTMPGSSGLLSAHSRASAPEHQPQSMARRSRTQSPLPRRPLQLMPLFPLPPQTPTRQISTPVKLSNGRRKAAQGEAASADADRVCALSSPRAPRNWCTELCTAMEIMIPEAFMCMQNLLNIWRQHVDTFSSRLK